MRRFKAFDVVTKVHGALRRIAKIEFGPDGSIYVFFPGVVDTSGIVCRALLRAGISGPTKLDLKENGKVTSHLVKYAHHPDGRAHFSQTGKVRTDVYRQSVPLKQHLGHFFTIQAQDFSSFAPLSASRSAQLTANLPDEARALKITGWRFRLDRLQIAEGSTPIGSPKGIKAKDGTVRLGLFVAPPKGAPFDDVVLFLAFEEIPWLSADRASHLIFVGGFDTSDIALNHSFDTEFLALAYPCRNVTELAQSIGSIDVVPDVDPSAWECVPHC